MQCPNGLSTGGRATCRPLTDCRWHELAHRTKQRHGCPPPPPPLPFSRERWRWHARARTWLQNCVPFFSQASHTAHASLSALAFLFGTAPFGSLRPFASNSDPAAAAVLGSFELATAALPLPPTWEVTRFRSELHYGSVLKSVSVVFSTKK